MPTLIEDLAGAPAALASLRGVFARHAGASQDWPEDGTELRSLAARLLREGQAEKGSGLLLGALEDMRRYFEVEDDDDDAGWHRSETKQWQVWAYARALRSALVDNADAPWRAGLLTALAALWEDAPADTSGWIDERDFEEPFFEEDIAPQLSDDALRDLVQPDGTEIDDATELLDALYRSRRIAERLLALNEPAPAARLAVRAFALEASADELDLAVSQERDAVAYEQSHALEKAIEQALAAEPKLRVAVRAAAVAEGEEIARRVARLLGEATDDEVREDIARLRARRDAATSDAERREAEQTLAFDFGDHLDDDEYLPLCQRLGFTYGIVRRLLQRGRDEEALAAASDETTASYSLRHVAEAFFEADRPALAERFLRPHAGKDPFFAELFVRALVAQRKDAADACFEWFKQRPTAEIYASIEGSVQRDAWPSMRSRLHEYLSAKNFHTTLVDIAVRERDAAALEGLIPRLRGAALEHARVRVHGMLPLLSAEAQNTLELVRKRAKATAPEPPTKVPTHVRHPKFGRGRVLRAEGSGDQRKLVIAFEAHGEKAILARFVVPDD